MAMVAPRPLVGVAGAKSDGKGMFLAAIQEAAESSSPAPTLSPGSSPSVTLRKVVILNHGTVQQQQPSTVAADSDANVVNGLAHDYNRGLRNETGDFSGNMSPVVAGSSSELLPAAEGVLDPISRVLYTYPPMCRSPAHPNVQQILERTQSQSKVPGASQGGVSARSPYADSGYSDDQYSGVLKPEPNSLRRVDSSTSGKEKK
ncbi:hypothetical protein G647_07679 [Cladophialophora carrionii CBS 160.54]|uniref:Uncharacterized protein n=1 Tax=Cladophialophora carrionii CBS 160.54 TaxID=1279043 RepID=V9D4V7_9EURO|nr:uncharacterized protein G647_07679 [Cladophialophora carrionii CBS 160.54]ETI21333.1 hypothetical protein G647_07679 [Cladophialophora carrionii CBS 160.54]